MASIGLLVSVRENGGEPVPPRDLHEIDAELKAVEAEIAALLDEVAE